MAKRTVQDTSEQPPARDRRLMAVGQVTAGIAHDVNNALTVVVWNLERLSGSHSASSKEAETVRVAINSAMDAARLLQRLLDYAGQNSYDPELIDVRELLAGMAPVLRALLRVEVVVENEQPVWPVIVDGTMLELALLDIAVALAAGMAANGSVSLTVANARPEDAGESAEPPILLSIVGNGVAADRPPIALQATLLQHFADCAGARVTMSATDPARREIRLHLPRAIGTSADGNVFLT